MYIAYLLIDKIFTFLGCYSNPKLGEDIMVMPTSGDIVWIVINTVLSSVLAFYMLHKLKDEF
jgi:hypothetical protein